MQAVIATIMRVCERRAVKGLHELASVAVPTTRDVLRGRASERVARGRLREAWRGRGGGHQIDAFAVAVRGHVKAILEEARVANDHKPSARPNLRLLQRAMSVV